MGTEAIMVLAGGIKQDASDRWVSTALTAEDDKRSAPGGKLRILAAAVLATKHPHALVITGGGKGYDVLAGTPEERPLLAEILRDELMDCGVPVERMVLESNSNSTYQELHELEKLIAEKKWKSVILITNRYHLPRLRAIIKAKFPKLVTVTNPVSAEEILLEEDQARWEAPIREAYGSSFMEERIAKEERSLSQIQNGTYQFR